MPESFVVEGGGDIPYGYPDQYSVYCGEDGAEVEQNLIWWRLVEVENEMYQLEVTLGEVKHDDTNVVRDKAIRVQCENNQIFRGIITSVEFDTYGMCKVMAYDNSYKLRKRMISTLSSATGTEGRMQYTNTPVNTMVKELCSSNGDGATPWIVEIDTTDTGSTYGNVSMRFENVSRLDAFISLCRAIDYDWWISHGAFPYTDTILHLAPYRCATDNSRYTFTTGVEATANCVNVQRELDNESLANIVTVLGYGDGINQARTEIFAATDTYTTLTANIEATTGTGVAIAVLSTSGFPSQGKLLVGTEVVAYTGTTATTFTGITRGSTDVDSEATTALKHYAGCIVLEYYDANTVTYYTKTSPKTDSSIEDNGQREFIYEDKSLILNEDNVSVPILELIATRFLLERMTAVERITLTPQESLEVNNAVRMGYYVTVTDENTGLTGTYRVVKREMGLSESEGLFNILYLSNVNLLYTQEMNALKKAQEQQGIMAQGATNIYAISASENCSATSESVKTNIGSWTFTGSSGPTSCGVRFYTNSACTLTGVVWGLDGGHLRARLFSDAGAVLATSTTRSGGKYVFNYDLSASTYYRVEVDNSGSWWGYDVAPASWPMTGTLIRVTGTSFDGVGTGTGSLVQGVDSVEVRSSSGDNYLNMRFYVPAEAIAINKCLLKYKVKPYRAYSYGTSAASGGVSAALPSDKLSGDVDQNKTFLQTWSDMFSYTVTSGYNGAEICCEFGVRPDYTNTYKHLMPIWIRLKIVSGGTTTYAYSSGIITGLSYSSYSGTLEDSKLLPSMSSHISTGKACLTGDVITLQAATSATANGDRQYCNYTFYPRMDHTHTISNTLNYAITESTLSSPSVSIYTGIDGDTMTLEGTYTDTEKEIDITDEIKAIGAGNWANIQFRPNKNMRIEANAILQVWINSE